jgi:phosphatidylinositol alpha-1,6-mannosyltransferase
MPMRDLFITIDFPPDRGGVARYYGSLLSAMRFRRIDVLTQPIRQSDINQSAPRINGEIIRKNLLLRPPWWPRWIPILWHVIRGILKDRPVFLYAGQLLPVGTVTMIASAVFRIPYCVFLHGLDLIESKTHARKRWLARCVMSHAACLIVNSTATKNLIDPAIRNKEVLIVTPGCSMINVSIPKHESDELRQKFRCVNSFVLFSLARLVERKGIHVMIRALKNVLHDIPHVQYIIGGDGPYRHALERLTREIRVQDHVMFLGDISEREAMRWYATCDLFCLTPCTLGGKDVEGYGIVYLEAGAFGKPVIGTRTGGVSEAVEHEKTGILVPENDPVKTANAIRKILMNHQYAEALGREGKRRVEADASWDRRMLPLVHWISRKKLEQ